MADERGQGVRGRHASRRARLSNAGGAGGGGSRSDWRHATQATKVVQRRGSRVSKVTGGVRRRRARLAQQSGPHPDGTTRWFPPPRARPPPSPLPSPKELTTRVFAHLLSWYDSSISGLPPPAMRYRFCGEEVQGRHGRSGCRAHGAHAAAKAMDPACSSIAPTPTPCPNPRPRPAPHLHQAAHDAQRVVQAAVCLPQRQLVGAAQQDCGCAPLVLDARHLDHFAALAQLRSRVGRRQAPKETCESGGRRKSVAHVPQQHQHRQQHQQRQQLTAASCTIVTQPRSSGHMQHPHATGDAPASR